MSQTTAEREVEPNARYDAIFGTNYEVSDEEVLSDEFEGLRAETWRERRVLDDLDGEAERLGFEEIDDEEKREVLTWDAVSVAEDSQLLASICSYFNGVSSGEGVEEIRRKLRTGDVEWYVNAFLVARGIIDS